VDEQHAAATVTRLKADAEENRRRPYSRRSRLDRFEDDLLTLHAAGARVVDLQSWLKEQRITVSHSTISRWLEKRGIYERVDV
jgi:predicted GNAT family acetyltransferase